MGMFPSKCYITYITTYYILWTRRRNYSVKYYVWFQNVRQTLGEDIQFQEKDILTSFNMFDKDKGTVVCLCFGGEVESMIFPGEFHVHKMKWIDSKPNITAHARMSLKIYCITFTGITNKKSTRTYYIFEKSQLDQFSFLYFNFVQYYYIPLGKKIGYLIKICKYRFHKEMRRRVKCFETL